MWGTTKRWRNTIHNEMLEQETINIALYSWTSVWSIYIKCTSVFNAAIHRHATDRRGAHTRLKYWENSLALYKVHPSTQLRNSVSSTWHGEKIDKLKVRRTFSGLCFQMSRNESLFRLPHDDSEIFQLSFNMEPSFQPSIRPKDNQDSYSSYHYQT
jgi:hypothetical protein